MTMASEASDGPTQKRPRMVSYPNFRPAGYDFSKQHEKRDSKCHVNTVQVNSCNNDFASTGSTVVELRHGVI